MKTNERKVDTMQAWHVRVGFTTQEDKTEDVIVDAVERLEGNSPSGSIGQGRGHVAFFIDSPAPIGEVTAKALTLAAKALGPDAAVTEVSIMPEAEFLAELDQPQIPEVVGFAEIAEMAGVSRQRAHQLAASEGFPPPVIETRQGMLMRKAAVERWLERRNTRPGRRKATA